MSGSTGAPANLPYPTATDTLAALPIEVAFQNLAVATNTALAALQFATTVTAAQGVTGLQAAVNAAVAAGGGVIVCQPGIWNWAAGTTLTIPINARNLYIFAYGAVFQLPAGFNQRTIVISDLTTPNNRAEHIGLIGGTILGTGPTDAAHQSQSGIEVDAIIDCMIRDWVWQSIPGDAFIGFKSNAGGSAAAWNKVVLDSPKMRAIGNHAISIGNGGARNCDDFTMCGYPLLTGLGQLVTAVNLDDAAVFINAATVDLMGEISAVGNNGLGGQWVGNPAGNPSTTIDAPSNGVNLAAIPGGILNVVSAAALNNTGVVWIQSTAGAIAIAYTGKTGTTLTGCTNVAGGGTVATGNQVVQGLGYQNALTLRDAAGLLHGMHFEANCNRQNNSSDVFCDTTDGGIAMAGLTHSWQRYAASTLIKLRGNPGVGFVVSGASYSNNEPVDTVGIFVDANTATNISIRGLGKNTGGGTPDPTSWVTVGASTTGEWVVPGTPPVLTSRTAIGTNQDFDINTAGKGLKVAEGANAKQGTAVLAAGAVVVANTSVTANSRILVTVQALGTVLTPKAVAVTAVTPGVNFTITSADATDTSTVAYEIFEPG